MAYGLCLTNELPKTLRCDPGFSGRAEVAVVVEKAEATVAAWARVLLVEDEADIRELIRYSLAQAGLEVEEASDGAEALDKLRAFAPDLIVLDLMLPGMPGLEVCQRLRSRADTARAANHGRERQVGRFRQGAGAGDGARTTT